ncbi:unnamed protein product [Trifolium pratense]|uniref:Uncharacterized protein n=1 Tax=Trifolium pratense TaxID=57577 RepID=A0ACB0KBS4_TRIPR|nr:unnamed protein product [Trifolium pratense]
MQVHIQNQSTFAAIIFSILQVLNEDQASLFMIVLWSIWQQRNNKLWRNVSDSIQFTCERANKFLSEWKGAQLNHEVPVQQQRSIPRWIKPQSGRYKCNVMPVENQNKVGIGMCIRDDQGCFVLARTEWISPILNVEIGEAIGLLKALNWVHELQLANVDFEFDSQIVVTRFHGN